MRISLLSPVRKAAFLGGSIAVGLLFWALCWQSLVEFWVTRSEKPEGYEKAARIQPLNAFHLHRLGSYYTVQDSAHAAKLLEQAVRINPHASLAWLNLSRIYNVLEETEKQKYAIEQALINDPRNVDVEWEGSLFRFQSGDTDGALRLVREVIANDPGKAQEGIQAAYRATGGDDAKSLQAIPPTAVARLQFLRWLVEHDHPEAANRVWPSVAAGEGSLLSHDLFFYIDSLIRRREVNQAQLVWSWIGAHDADIQRRQEPGNLVVNGDFESNLLNGGFDWRYTRSDGVNVTVDTSVLHEGTRSLAIEFDADRLADAGVHQLIPVEPGTRYALHGTTRAEELESANGVRLAVSDYYANSLLSMSNETMGSTPWQEFSEEFTTGPDTHMVKISIVRSPSFGRIRGKLWIDDIRMEKKP